MLCIAAQSDPIGYLAVKKVPLSVNDIARMCGGSEPEVRTLVEELERNGVLSRDRNGTIYSRRIVRDAKKARTAQNNGKLGGNPTLRKQIDISSSDNLQDKGGLKTHIPEARNQETEKDIGASPPGKIYAFIGRTIRLEKVHLDKWRKSYGAIPDFMSALQAADDYYTENPPKDGKWFFPVSRWLEKQHTAHLQQKRASDAW